MARTVVGIFDNESDAREAVRRMQQEGGIQGSNIDISTNRHEGAQQSQNLDTARTREEDKPNSPWDSRSAGIDIDDTLDANQQRSTNPDFNPSKQGYSNSDAREEDTWDREGDLASPNQSRNHSSNSNQGIFDRIGNFFSNLFGDTDDARRYANASRNRTIVTVHAASPEQAEDAADILDECGAVDVNQQSNKGNVSNKDYNTSITEMDNEQNTGGYTRSEAGRRSRIFDRPVAAEYRLSDDYYYDNTTDLDYDRNRASNLGGRGDEQNKRKL